MELKLTPKTNTEARRQRKVSGVMIMFTILLFFLSMNLVSALDFKFDNFKTFEKGNLKYGKAIIWDKGQIGNDKKLMEITVINNSDNCLTDCYAEGTGFLYEKNKIVDSFRFKNTQLNSYQDIDYTFYLKENNDWVEYDGSQKKGEFEWRLEGTKPIYESIDWLGTFFGFEIKEWLLWDADMVLYYSFTSVAERVFGVQNLAVFEGAPVFTTANGLIEEGTFADDDNNLQIPGDALNGTAFNYTRNTSICLWVKPSATASNKVLTDWGAGDGLGRTLITTDIVGDGTGISLDAGGTITKNSGVFENGEWNQVCVTFNQTSATLYSNATLIGSTTSTFVFGGSSTTNFTIGINFVGGSSLVGSYDELGFWNRTLTAVEISELYNNGVGLGFGGGDTRVDLNLPVNDTQLKINQVNFSSNFTVNKGGFVFKNSTYYVSFSNGTLFNKTLVTVGTSNFTSLNISGFTPDNYFWNVFACAENLTGTRCVWGDNEINRTISASSTINSFTFNTTTFETAIENYQVNITTFAGGTPTNANFIYDGVSSSASVAASGSNFLISSIDSNIIALTSLNTNRTFNFTWQLNGVTEVSNNTNQTVFPILFDLCNSTLTTRYINVSYKNETLNQERVNATIDSTWVHFLGDGSINKTLTFINSTEGIEHGFCFSPPDRKLFANVVLLYNNAESQQRTFIDSLTLTNTTAQKILFLLPTRLGIFATFRTEDTVSNTIRLVNAVITRTLGGAEINVASGLTDDSGIAVFFLNPDVSYMGTFSKTGFTTNQFTFVPITDTRIVIMGTVGGEVNGTQITLGTTYDILPKNQTLNNNTDVTFGFNVTSGQDITLISMNITNSSGGQLGFQSNAGQGFISQVINTGNLTKIIGRYEIQTANETIKIVKLWIVGTEFEGDYSLFKQMKLFLDYEFSDFIRLLIVIAVIFGIIIFMSAREITDTSESKVMVVILLLWVFSLFGWLDNPAVVAETGIAEFSRQYGIAILSTLAASFFVLRRLFIRRI